MEEVTLAAAEFCTIPRLWQIECPRGLIAWHIANAVITTGSLADFPMRGRSCIQRKYIAEQTQQSAKMLLRAEMTTDCIGRRRTYTYAMTEEPLHDTWTCGPSQSCASKVL